jgi:hypothetical protein
MELPAVRRDDNASIDDRRSLYPAVFNPLAKRGIGIIPRVANVPDGRKTRLQHGHAIPHPFNGTIGRGVQKRCEIVVAMIALGDDCQAQNGCEHQTSRGGP